MHGAMAGRASPAQTQNTEATAEPAHACRSGKGRTDNPVMRSTLPQWESLKPVSPHFALEPAVFGDCVQEPSYAEGLLWRPARESDSG